jgi:hypothetical protein
MTDRYRDLHGDAWNEWRDEIGRFDAVEEASEASHQHHIGHGHNPGLITGVFRDV